MAADRVTGADGTQEPAPLPWLSDPLAGLVTGDNLPGVRWDQFEPPRVVAAPKLPDASGMREALDAVLGEPATRPAQTPPPSIGTRSTPGIVKPSRQWPAAAAVARRLRATKDEALGRTSAEPPPYARPAGVRTGISVVIVIVLVTIVILYYAISSLADTFSHLFG